MKYLDGYIDYRISSNGNIWSFKAGRHLMKIHIDSKGYKSIRLCENGKSKLHRVHRLLAIAFKPNPNNHPCINHIDGNKLNNHLSNLEWCTYGKNNTHAYRNGLKAVVGRKLNSLQVSIIKHLFFNINDRKISNIFNVTRETIRDIRMGKLWKLHNFGDWKIELS